MPSPYFPLVVVGPLVSVACRLFPLLSLAAPLVNSYFAIIPLGKFPGGGSACVVALAVLLCVPVFPAAS